MLVVFVLLAALHSSDAASLFKPTDEFLVSCGSKTRPTLPDGRAFKSDGDALTYLNSQDNILVSADAPTPLYSDCRIFKEDASYTFALKESGWHWIRLHFYPLKNTQADLRQVIFSVTGDKYVLLHNFNADNDSVVVKEYLVNVTEPKLSITFKPLKKSAAFVNAIEVVTAPDGLISESATNLSPVQDFPDLGNFAFQTVYRLNMGGPPITSANDTLQRTWQPDTSFLTNPALARKASVAVSTVKYPEASSPYIAPPAVYATAEQMADAETRGQSFNVSWKLDADGAYSYLVRFHFCDIVSKILDDLYFNVYVNGKTAISNLDLSSVNGELATAYYKDIVVGGEFVDDELEVEIGPNRAGTGTVNAILNGLEVLKMSNSDGNLDGEFEEEESNGSNHRMAIAGIVMGFGAMAGVGAMVMRWRRRPEDWQRRNSFSSWLLPIHAGDSTFMNSKSGSKTNFNSSTFGLGTLEDGTKVAVKRGNPQSEQGLTEFQTEIQMLSKLRHRHLVSLIG